MNRKLVLIFLIVLTLGACASNPDKPSRPWWKIAPFSWFDAHGNGQAVFHWQRPHTGVQRFAKDHTFCMKNAMTFKLIPAAKKWFHNIFYTEEKNLDIRADWNGKSGIWATYIPYPGAQPLVVNVPTPEEDDDIDYQAYVDCMEERGYIARNYNIPEITNIYLDKMYQ